jgi:hypothetical protein
MQTEEENEVLEEYLRQLREQLANRKQEYVDIVEQIHMNPIKDELNKIQHQLQQACSVLPSVPKPQDDVRDQEVNYDGSSLTQSMDFDLT